MNNAHRWCCPMNTTEQNAAKEAANVALLQSEEARKSAESAMAEADLAYQAIRALKDVEPSTHNDKNTLKKAEYALKEARQALQRGEEARKEAEAARVRVELARTKA